MDGLSIAGGGSLGPRHEALASQRPYQQALILFRVPIGLADPQDLGSCVIELVTRQLMVGNFKQPGPPRTAVWWVGGWRGTPATAPPPPWGAELFKETLVSDHSICCNFTRV